MTISQFSKRLGVDERITQKLIEAGLISLNNPTAVQSARTNNRVISYIAKLNKELKAQQADEAARAAAVEKIKDSEQYKNIQRRRANLDKIERQLVESVIAGASQ